MTLNFRHILLLVATWWTVAASAQEKILLYSPGPSEGLHAAVLQGDTWSHLGQLCSSDYGAWGAEKKMYNPSVCRAKDGSWRLVFQVNTVSPCFAAAYSKDLTTWRPQDYPRMSTRNCLNPVVCPVEGGFEVQYESEGRLYEVMAEADFRHFSEPRPVADGRRVENASEQAVVKGKTVSGQVFGVTSEEVIRLKQYFADQEEDARLSSERMYDDSKLFAKLLSDENPTVFGMLTVDPSREKAISDKLIGIFFEDISYAADGGLYAEMVQNRDFEYSARDHRGWTSATAWQASRPLEVTTEHPLSKNNPHYAMLWPKDTLRNDGWDGMVVEKGKKYDFSMYVLAGGQKQDFLIQLVGEDGTVLAKSMLKTRATDWTQYSTVLTAKGSDAKAHLAIVPQKAAHVGVDMISLFPQETFMGRKNGLRKDLAQVIADLKPKFVRFPGGCMSHGQGLDNIYHWNETVGPLQDRKPDMNIWHYHQTRGLGFYEYFQFCEDIGAEPLPVLAAGVPCQNSQNNSEGFGGQQGGIPMDQMDDYVDELCNLIDWANADPVTNKWAHLRAEAGHPAPFNLKYLGIGNEDIISTVFEERYEMICKAIRERHPEIKICGTVGPFHNPSADYIEGWDFTKKHPNLQYMTDEHYYESTGWFMYHRDYYDNYDRKAPKVYLGEWAASTKVKRPNVETALAEALYLTDVERNGDVVEMTSYAPMLCKDGHSNWNPNMIYFSNSEVRTTPAYEVQRLFSISSGDRYVESTLKLENNDYAYRVGASLVRDSKTGRRYLKLVNALPATLKLTVSGLQIPQNARCYQFAGKVDDQKARAEEITPAAPTILPPYSLRIIEL